MNARLTDADQPQALTPYELTYSPAYRPSGAPINPNASRQELQERRTTVVEALTAEAATDSFERSFCRMVTACIRVQLDSLQTLQHRWLYEISELDAMARPEITNGAREGGAA